MIVINISKYKFTKKEVFIITGVAGFIGSNLTEKILEIGCKVIGIDNLSSGKLNNISEFLDNPLFEFHQLDIRDFDSCESLFKDVDYVLHHAALGSVPKSLEEPILYSENNVIGTLNMLEASRLNNVKKFIYASSSAVYGESESLPKIEGEEGSILSPYALTKEINESYAKMYNELYNLQTIGLRYFNVFGKKQDANGQYAAVIPKFIKNLMNDEPAIIYGDGNQSRDFTYIDNVIEANLKACFADEIASGKSFNIAVGEKIYLNNLYYNIRELMNKDIIPVYEVSRKGDIKHSVANIDNAKNYLNYNPVVSFSSGLNEVIQWYKSNKI